MIDLREPISAGSHGLWMLLSLPGIWLLWRRGGQDLPKRLSLLVFGACLAFCYAASALYHGLRLPDDRMGFFERLDYVGIFGLIAGSYTPLAWNVLRGAWRRVTLAAVWGVALTASAAMMLHGLLPHPVSTGVYLVMGWGVVACYSEVARVLSHRALRPLLAGGVVYTAGAVLNLLGWPVLWPGVLRAHEVFHFFVMGGSLLHFWFMLTVIAPFERALVPDAVPTGPRRRPSPGRFAFADWLAVGGVER